jgi:hypothetical protein
MMFNSRRESGLVLALGLVFIAGSAQASILVYSNFLSGPTAGYSKPAGAQIGDELFMTQGGILNAVGFSVYNSGTSDGPLNTADLTLDFWNYTGIGWGYDKVGTLVFDNYDFGATGLPPGYYTTLTFGDIASSQTINLSDDILAVLTLSDFTGGATKAGQVLYDPPTVGSSDDNFYMNDLAAGGTSDGWFWFGGSPVANFGWSIEVNNVPPVPEPATAFLLGAGLIGLTAFRRRFKR